MYINIHTHFWLKEIWLDSSINNTARWRLECMVMACPTASSGFITRATTPCIAVLCSLIFVCLVCLVCDIIFVDLFWTVYAICVPLSIASGVSVAAWLRGSAHLMLCGTTMLCLFDVGAIVFTVGQFRPWSIVTTCLCIVLSLTIAITAIQAAAWQSYQRTAPHGLQGMPASK